MAQTSQTVRGREGAEGAVLSYAEPKGSAMQSLHGTTLAVMLPDTDMAPNLHTQYGASAHYQYMGHGSDGLGAVMNQLSSLTINDGQAVTADSNMSQFQGADAYYAPQFASLQHLNIPQAVPAIFTRMKSIEQCLEKPINGVRNVYIQGLSPTTDDELLLRYVSRFGKVEQSKVIIDSSTGACKGFGFAKFADVRDSEECIRGFYDLGYNVSFAHERLNARRKVEGDQSSTNLYFSNLPKSIDRDKLRHIFSEYHLVSSRILCDSMGNSRGVGFARFGTREECEEIIRKYNGVAVNGEKIMQVRYADTPAQKKLKRITANRQHRTGEHDIAYSAVDNCWIYYNYNWPPTYYRPW